MDYKSHNKEYYIKQVKDIGEYLIEKADYILEDFDKEKIRCIEITSLIEPSSYPTVKISKEYFPKNILEG